jgi:biopolymer transport protein ExbB
VRVLRDRFGMTRAVFWPALLAGVACLAAPDLLVVSGARVEAQETSPDTTVGGDPSEGQGPGAARPGPARAGDHESFFTWMPRTLGPIGLIVALVIAVMSFYLFALVFWMALQYRRQMAMPRRLVRELQDLLEHKKYSEAYHRVAADDSLLARVLAAGVRKLPSGLPMAQRAMELANEDATMEMEHRTTYLATVGTLGPMIGLVGTVYGMIVAFRVIASEGSSPQASQLAAGISTALVSTLLGIGISIPAIFFYSMFRNRIARLSLEVAMGAEPLLEQFAPGIRTPEPSAAPTQPQSQPSQPPMPVPKAIPMGGPTSHPHPYAATAALTASSTGSSRSALPPADAE